MRKRPGRRPTSPLTPETLTLGQHIRRARLRLDLTGEEVHRLTGINPTSLSFIERGLQAASATQLQALASALRTTLRFTPSKAA